MKNGIKLKNGVHEGGKCAIEGTTGVWLVDRITLRGDVYVRNPETNETRMAKTDKVFPVTKEQNSGF